jgi:mRNA-degrading endonuclease toxin of MazEF toxin-antitoxin module
MDQWDIYNYAFPHPIGEHPVVITSPSELAMNPDIRDLNGFMVTTLREARAPRKLEVVLDEADSLHHLSVVRVHPIYQLSKDKLTHRLGRLSEGRIQALIRKIIEVYRYHLR